MESNEMMIPCRVRQAIVLAFLCHGLFILTARYRLSYDAYTHMLFAKHYADNWFSLWETRWYAGFEVVSYPPLTHQLIALFTPLVGFDRAFALILWIVTSAYPLGVYAFSRIFTGKSAASYAAMASAVLLPIYVAAYSFGQLPFLTATLLALFSAAALARYLRAGGLHLFVLAVASLATTVAAHHATVLILPFLIFASSVYGLEGITWKKTAWRLGLFLPFAAVAGFLVIWPFWGWGIHQSMQVPIDHLSRHNFFTDPIAFAIFFLPFYFPIGAVIPFLFQGWPRKFLGLQFSFVVLFILGLGGSTPLPSLIFGKGWEWLTYDRFAFWASLLLTPFFGILIIRFRRRWKPRFMLGSIPLHIRRSYIPALTFLIFACAAMGSWFTPILLPTQPGPIDMGPIVNFLNRNDRWGQWRYLTFGFGDQYVLLNLLTRSTTIDGSYHTARNLPELRESGIGQIDTALWTSLGVPAIDPILKKSAQRGVRWGFVNRREYVAELKKNGWVFVKFLRNGIQVWEDPKAVLPEPFEPPKETSISLFASFSWGMFPLLSLVVTLALSSLSLWPKQAERTVRGAHAFILGLLPLSLGFWYFRLAGAFDHPQVYTTYDDALFFLCDGFALLAVVLWCCAQVQPGAFTIRRYSPTIFAIAALCILITASTTWSSDWRTSAYLSMHFWLVFLLILSMRDWPECWNTVILGLCALLSIEVVTGIVGFVTRSTAFLMPLQLEWPGPLDVATRGASVLRLQDGEGFLRAYGTLPHPNILAGLILFCLLGPIALYLRPGRQRQAILLLVGIGTSLLMLTFSRSAWLGSALFFLMLLYRSRMPEHKKIITIIVVACISFGLTLIPLRELFLGRTTEMQATTEKFSFVGRVFLAQQALELIRERPWSGVGAGSFVIELEKRQGRWNYVEPVHNIPFLIVSELGTPAAVLLLAIVGLIGVRWFKNTKPRAILAGALLGGLGLIGLFDHYLWTLAPGRVLLGLAVGLWEGQAYDDEG